jgi:hypothetical protein
MVPVFAGGNCTPELGWSDRICTTDPQQCREFRNASGSPVLALDSIFLDSDLRCRVLLAGAHCQTWASVHCSGSSSQVGDRSSVVRVLDGRWSTVDGSVCRVRRSLLCNCLHILAVPDALKNNDELCTRNNTITASTLPDRGCSNCPRALGGWINSWATLWVLVCVEVK